MGKDKNDKDKTAKDWVDTDEDTDELVKKSFEAGDADKDWDEPTPPSGS